MELKHVLKVKHIILPKVTDETTSIAIHAHNASGLVIFFNTSHIKYMLTSVSRRLMLIGSKINCVCIWSFYAVAISSLNFQVYTSLWSLHMCIIQVIFIINTSIKIFCLNFWISLLFLKHFTPLFLRLSTRYVKIILYTWSQF